MTFDFAPSINSSTGLPDIMEVAVIPLADSTNATAGATFAGGLQTATVELSESINSVVFNLVPSYTNGNSTAITYRTMWRAGVLGRTYTYDFAMPDDDLTWDALIAGVGNIINGETYLQQTDLGVAGRVARLNDEGQVTDADGTPVAGSADITTLENSLNAETAARQAAVTNLNTSLQTAIANQTAATLSTAETYTNTQVGTLTNAIAGERSAREASDTDLQNQVTSNLTSLTTQGTTFSNAIATINTTLPNKADLDDNGFVLLDQIPPEILTSAIPVANQAAMLALSPTVAHKGDLAIRPDGIFLLVTDDPTTLSNWVSLSVVSSVNGKRGDLTLTASDVGAIAIGGAITQNQVTGLATTLLAKANASDLSALQSNVNALTANSSVAAFISTGTLLDASLPADIALVNTSGQVTTKNGTVVASGGGGGGGGTITSVNGHTTPIITVTLTDVSNAGGSITESQVTGLSTDLSNRVLTSDSRLTNARTPTAHASSHAYNGSDPITVAQNQVTGLPAIIGNNALTSSSNAVNRIGSLEGRVTTLETSGGGDGSGGAATTAVFYDSATTGSDVTDFTQVVLHSPWGIDSDGTITGTTGTPYYLHSGVRSQDVAQPYISPNGHLHLYQWNESGPADPSYALASDLSSLSTTVGTKANQSDLADLTTTVSGKASQSDLTSLTTTVSSKANSSDLSALATTVSQCATQAALTTTNNNVALKANQTDMVTAQNNITTINTTLGTKADLVAGVLKSSQIPTGIPQSSVTNLTTALAACATLTAGVLTASQIPTNIPQASISGLSTSLGAKADLVSGTVPVAQIPPQALTNVVQVANQAAMLALSTTQVQYGDFCIITGTSAAGTYILTGSPADPSQLSNWVLLTTSTPPVTSVNTYTGAVNLVASDVGALASNAMIPQSQVTGLVTQLGTYATSSSLTTGLAGKTAFSDVQAMFTNSTFTKRADYVATAAITALSGQQSVDGVLTPVGAVVLATAQPASVNNGLWVVSSTGWSRPADYATGSYIAKDTIVIVSNTTGASAGAASNFTIWQDNATSGFIDTANTTWIRLGYVSTPYAPTGTNGITISGSTFTANVLSGGGILAPSGGLQRDPNVIPGRFTTTLTGGSTVVGVTHNLNTRYPLVSIWDTTSNTMVLAGVTSTSVNAISIEFQSAPATGQYQVLVVG